MGGEGATTPTRAELFRDLASAAEGIAQALEDDDSIMGLLSSRAFVVAAYDLGEDFWAELLAEFPAEREERREIAVARVAGGSVGSEQDTRKEQ